MSKRSCLASSAIVLLAACALARGDDVSTDTLLEEVARANAESRARIMVLGIFHFAGSQTDEKTSGSAGMLSEKRQAEIADVVARLKEFNPTKIAVEIKASDADALDQSFNSYCVGKLELKEGEVHQIGFRLAKQLGHKRLFAIDADGRWLEPRIDLDAYAKEHGQSSLLSDPTEAALMAAAAKLDAHQREQPLASHLALLNSPAVLNLHHSVYLQRKLALGDATTYPGADGFVSQWYNRNLRIYGNLLRINEGKDDRILLIIGAAHAAILRHMLESSNCFEYVSPLEALTDNRQGRANPDSASDLLRRHRHAISLKDGRLRGPGLQWLLEQSKNAMFVLIGEPHNTRDVPMFTEALFHALREQNSFGHLALEQGDVICTKAAKVACDGGLPEVAALARSDAHAFHFRTDEELAMMVAVVRASADCTNALWGLDRTTGLQTALHALADALQPGPERSKLEAFAQTVLQHDKESDPDHPFLLVKHADVSSFAAGLAAAVTDDGVRRAATRLQRSADNLGLFVDGKRMEGTTDREEIMKDELRFRVDETLMRSGDPPRILLKMGHAHAARSGNQGSTQPLGGEAVQIAAEHSMTTFHINVQLINRPGQYWSLTEYPQYAVLAELGAPDEWVLVDLRPMQPLVADGQVELTPEVREVVTGYDALLLIGGGRRGGTSLQSEH